MKAVLSITIAFLLGCFVSTHLPPLSPKTQAQTTKLSHTQKDSQLYLKPIGMSSDETSSNPSSYYIFQLSSDTKVIGILFVPREDSSQPSQGFDPSVLGPPEIN